MSVEKKRKRFFNTAGTCIPSMHFTADISGKVQQVMEMIARGDYFIINRPRQYGKTTLIYHLFHEMQENKDYLAVSISFEGLGSSNYSKTSRFIPALLDLLAMKLEFMNESEACSLIKKNLNIDNFHSLSRFLTDFTSKTGRKVVLMIDEVDKSSNNQLFLDFLGMLRTKYLGRNEGTDRTFHSVILAGVHDIKSLKTKIRPEEEQKYNSPWNIAVKFKVEMALSPVEIASLLQQYSNEKQIKIDIPFLAEKIYYYTSGYPFLVSYLCKIFDEEILPQKKKAEWLPGDLSEAVRILLGEDTTNFESLIKNLENNPDLYELVFNIIMEGRDFSYNLRNPLIDFGTTHGILSSDGGRTKIHNRIYEQLIYDYMSSKLETSSLMKFDHIAGSYVENGVLLMEKIIHKFQSFMKEQYSRKDVDFIERNGRLIFLAFVKPIINGDGFDFKEVQVSEEKRLDVVITYAKNKYIIELKIWNGEAYHQQGIEQLCDYLERQNQSKGYLLIYDLRKKTGNQGKYEKIEKRGKEIYAAWI